MIVKWLFDNSTSGPLAISTRAVFLAGGGICASVGSERSRLPSVAAIASLRTSPFIVIARTSERVGRWTTFDLRSSASVVQLDGQGIGGPSTFALGRGGTPQTCGEQGGSGGVGMSDSLPWVAAVPPVAQVPVKVSLSGYGVVKPSVSVCRKATIWFSS